MSDRFKSFDAVNAASESMMQEKEMIIDVNQHTLYEEGKGKDNNPLPPYKSKTYADMKQKMRGKSIVDGYLSGKMQSDMTLTVQGGEYTIFSTAPYTQYFLNQRPTAFGLTPEGKVITWNIMHAPFVAILKAHTNTN